MKDTLQPLSTKEIRHAKRVFFGTIFSIKGGWIACLLISSMGLILCFADMELIGLMFFIPASILSIVTWNMGQRVTFTLHPNTYTHSGKLRHKNVVSDESVIVIDKYLLLASIRIDMKLFQLIKKYEGKKVTVSLAVLEQSSNSKSTFWYTPLRIENDLIIDENKSDFLKP